MTKQKLIQQYKEKIEICETKLKKLGENVREFRRGAGPWDIDELRKDQKIENTQRQCYIQFVSDLEYELD
jgi:hypothetical protein